MADDGIDKGPLRLLNKKFWSRYDSKVNKWTAKRRVFWSKTETTTTLSPYSDDVKKKIITAFCSVTCPLNGVLQFWAPVPGGLLSTSDQPFTFDDLEPVPYWSLCSRYQCRIIDDKPESGIVTGGPLPDAFNNRFPAVVTDLSLYKGKTPLVNKALHSGYGCLILIPVFYPCQTSPCVGVVECCLKPSALVDVFYTLNVALEATGLSMYDAKQSPSYQTMQVNIHDIQEALNIVCHSHHLSIGQVWISVPSPFSTHQRKFFVRLCGYLIDYAHLDFNDQINDYYDNCGMLPLRMGEGLPGKTFQTSEPRFSKNLDDLCLSGLLGALSSCTDCSSLVICLRSSVTGDGDYVFEFLWPHRRNHLIVLESLLLTLKRCLPCFYFPSGAQLGEELRLLDVHHFKMGNGYFKIFQGNTSSQPLKQELQRPNLCYVIADYRGTLKLVTLQSSFTLADAKDKVEKCFNLDPGAYTMEYELNGEKLMLNTDENLCSCINRWRSAQNTSGENIQFKLSVQASRQCADQHDPVDK